MSKLKIALDTLAQLERGGAPLSEAKAMDRRTVDITRQYREAVEPYRTAIAMVREAIGELFGPVASLESDEATLLRGGPEPTHDAEAIIEALQRVKAAIPQPECAHDWVNGRSVMHDCPTRICKVCGKFEYD